VLRPSPEKWTWIVTGASGFVGATVPRALRMAGVLSGSIVTLGRKRPASCALEQFLEFDLRLGDPDRLTQALAHFGPLAVIHAAGLTPPADPKTMYSTNTRGTACLLEALRRHRAASRVVLAGSAAELGPVPDDQLPACEQTPCRPIDSYGLSKWSSSRLGVSSSVSGRMEVMVGRLFNPIGPGMPTGQVFGRIARDLATRPGQIVELTVGNLGASRDFFDVRDAGGALVTLVQEGKPGQVYHVASGRPHTVAEGLGHLIRLSGRHVTVRSPADPPRLGPASSWASINRILEETSWRPRFSFEQSLQDIWAEVSERHVVDNHNGGGPRRVA